ncbi:hypothetical protein DFH08DRAFT_819705 [Mycena albidolilacea]|uniref:Uncharacterized protein n=1 Tax=Mycena albidolilacea TaxID=1033008 RepID=A0AAD7EG72_9AGAR|nr:hypothetical protein DFH08DRAFT_819705 [Mycena albidolilacea]
MSLASLNEDLVILVCLELSIVDIFSLQQACCTLCRAKRAKILWVHVLERQKHKEGKFLPSYMKKIPAQTAKYIDKKNQTRGLYLRMQRRLVPSLLALCPPAQVRVGSESGEAVHDHVTLNGLDAAADGLNGLGGIGTSKTPVFNAKVTFNQGSRKFQFDSFGGKTGSIDIPYNKITDDVRLSKLFDSVTTFGGDRTGFNSQESIFHVLGPVPESSDSKVGFNDCSDNNSNSVRRSGSIRIDNTLGISVKTLAPLDVLKMNEDLNSKPAR